MISCAFDFCFPPFNSDSKSPFLSFMPKFNETLVNYDFDVVMPGEDAAIREKRKTEDAKKYELVSDIPIQNPDDVNYYKFKEKHTGFIQNQKDLWFLSGFLTARQT